MFTFLQKKNNCELIFFNLNYNIKSKHLNFEHDRKVWKKINVCKIVPNKEKKSIACYSRPSYLKV